MKYIFLIILMGNLNAHAQSSYSSANQDTESNEHGTHLDTGYSNKDVEKEEVEFSSEEEPESKEKKDEKKDRTRKKD
jgi:hypothetical protein